MNGATYVIINASDVSSVDFDLVMETSAETLCYSVDGTKTFVKFVGADEDDDDESAGSTPSFLEGKTHYSNSEILSILDTSEWAGPNDPPE